jgi:hypothetical protein
MNFSYNDIQKMFEEVSPELKQWIKTQDDYYYTGLTTVFFEDCILAFVRNDKNPPEAWISLFPLLEYLLEAGDRDIEDAIATTFVEAIVMIPEFSDAPLDKAGPLFVRRCEILKENKSTWPVVVNDYLREGNHSNSQSMTDLQYNADDFAQKLLQALPELREPYLDKKMEWDGETPALYIVVEDILSPFLKERLFQKGQEDVLTRGFAFLDRMARSSDSDIQDLLRIGIGEVWSRDEYIYTRVKELATPSTLAILEKGKSGQ